MVYTNWAAMEFTLAPEGVRKAHERMGPAGLTHGVLNDRLQFDTVMSLAPGRREAHVRGIEMGMLGDADKGEACWEVSVYRQPLREGKRHLEGARNARVSGVPLGIQQGLGQEPHRREA